MGATLGRLILAASFAALLHVGLYAWLASRPEVPRFERVNVDVVSIPVVAVEKPEPRREEPTVASKPAVIRARKPVEEAAAPRHEEGVGASESVDAGDVQGEADAGEVTLPSPQPSPEGRGDSSGGIFTGLQAVIQNAGHSCVARITGPIRGTGLMTAQFCFAESKLSTSTIQQSSGNVMLDAKTLRCVSEQVSTVGGANGCFTVPFRYRAQ